MSNLFWSTSPAIFVSSSFVFILNESLARVSATSWSRFRSRLELSLPKTIRPGVAHAFHERHLLFSPLIQCRRFDLGYVHAQPAMRSAAVGAEKHSQRRRRPPGQAHRALGTREIFRSFQTLLETLLKRLLLALAHRDVALSYRRLLLSTRAIAELARLRSAGAL